MEIDATDKPIEQYVLENFKKKHLISTVIWFAVVSSQRKGKFRQYLIK